MRPVQYEWTESTSTVEAFGVGWSALVVKVTPVVESEHRYLAAIARYSNNPPPDGLFAVALDLAADAEMDRLVGAAHALPHVQSGLAAHLLADTAAAKALTAFAPDPATLYSKLEAAKFEYLRPFHLEGTLAEDLFFYGMYDYFYRDHSAGDARDLAHALVVATVGGELEDMVPFTTRLPWGDWFDPHSSSDRSWLLLSRRTRRAWVFAFSHSD
jgi:hypothetical protein